MNMLTRGLSTCASLKRKDYLTWDEYFMGVALISAERSKDPNTQVGACIVSKDNKILSVGYNGAPNGYDDEHMPWDSPKSIVTASLTEGAPTDNEE